MKLIILSLFSLLLIACGGSNSNDPSFTSSITINVSATGQQEVPPVDTAGTASAVVEVDEALMHLRASLDISGIADVQAAHIHAGYAGENGPVAFAFTTTDDADMLELSATEITSELLEAMLDGAWYINVHTTDYPNGEVRGQILSEDFSLITFGLNGSQEVPAVATDASGAAYATYNRASTELKLTVVTSDVEDATGAHIHTGRIGENGPVLVGLEQSSEDANVWSTPADVMIDSVTLDVLLSGGHYVNVHTPANASGEIRGQILTDNLVLVTFDLSGEQEVPAVDTDATGSGYAIVNSNDYALELKVVTSGVEDATAAHIHTGRIGFNGGVFVALEQDAEDVNVWAAPPAAMLDAEIFGVLASGGHYVNVHTPANASGELRGQILTDDFVFLTFPLSGDQEVPPVTTTASGDGYALVNTFTYALELVAVTDGLEATAAHIHTGESGESGDVLLGLEQSTEDTGTWVTPAGSAINAEIFSVLAGGGHYVNVHTAANPSGEIRGQIE